MNLRKRQNIMVGALYTAFAYYWLVEMYYYMRWGFYLREDEKVTGPVQSDPLNTGTFDVDPFERERWNNRMYRTSFIIAFANNAAMMALALEYQPYQFEIVAEWVWCGFAMVYLIAFPLERFPILIKLADLGMLCMNIALTVAGLIGCGDHDI